MNSRLYGRYVRAFSRVNQIICETLESRRLLCATPHGDALWADGHPDIPLQPQVFTQEELDAAAAIDAQHQAEVDTYLANKAKGIGAAGLVEGQAAPARIIWTNRGQSDDGMAATFGGNASVARNVVDAALNAWERVITNFHWPDNEEDTDFLVDVSVSGPGCGGAADTGSDDDGVPQDGDLTYKDGSSCAGGSWWLDPTPTENSEFRGNISNAFAMDAQAGSPASGRHDFYTVIVLEMTHLLGMSGDEDFLFEDLNDNTPPFSDTGTADAAFDVGTLWRYNFGGGSNVKVLYTDNNGGTGGSDTDEPLHTAEPNAGNLLSSGGVNFFGVQDSDNAVFEGSRRYLPSRLDTHVFDEIYPFSLTYPERFGTAYADLDSTGNLLIRGGSTTGNAYGSLTNSNDVIVLTKPNATQLQVNVLIGKPVPGTDTAQTLSSIFNISAINSITIQSGDGDDVILLDSVPVFTQVSPGTGNDTIRVGGFDYDTNILANVQILDTGGTDDVNIADDNDSADDTYIINGSSFTKDSTSVFTTFFSVEGFGLVANPGNNTINLISSTSLDVAINGENGNDTFNLASGNLDSLGDSIVLTGGNGSDTVEFNDSNQTLNKVWSIGANSTARTSFGPTNYNTVEHLIIDAGDANNTFQVLTLDDTMSLVINAGIDNDLVKVGVGWGYQVDGPVTVNGSSGDDTLLYNDLNNPGGGIVDAIYGVTANSIQNVGHGKVTWSSIQHFTLDATQGYDFINFDGASSLTEVVLNGNDGPDGFGVTDGDVDAAIFGTPTINGGGGDDVIYYNDQNNLLGSTYTITADLISKANRGGSGNVAYGSVELIDLYTSAHNDNVHIDSLGGPNFPFNLYTDVNVIAIAGDDNIFVGDGTMTNMFGDVTVSGGDGADDLVIDDHDNPFARDWIITSTSVDRNPGTLTTYDTVETLTVNGGDSTDTFTAQSLNIPATVNGGGGDDTLTVGIGNLATVPGALAWNGQTHINGDSVILDDSIYIFGTVHNITPTTVTRTLFGGLTYATTELLTLKAPGTAGTVNVNGTNATTPVIIYPNDGTDVIHVSETSPAAPVTIKNSAGNDHVDVNNDGGGFAKALFDETIILNSLTIANNGQADVTPGGNKVLRLLSLTMGSLATLDLNDNDMIQDSANVPTSNANLANLTYYIGHARNTGGGGLWTGYGITSSAARNHPDGLTSLSVVRNTDDGISVLHSIFSGQFVFQNAILVKYTWTGDADLTGNDDADDYFQIDNGFASDGALTGWRNGDFDYSGDSDADDYFLIDSAFAKQDAILAQPPAAKVQKHRKPAVIQNRQPVKLKPALRSLRRV